MTWFISKPISAEESDTPHPIQKRPITRHPRRNGARGRGGLLVRTHPCAHLDRHHPTGPGFGRV